MQVSGCPKGQYCRLSGTIPDARFFPEVRFLKADVFADSVNKSAEKTEETEKRIMNRVSKDCTEKLFFPFLFAVSGI